MKIPRVIQRQLKHFLETDGCSVIKLIDGSLGLGYATVLNDCKHIYPGGDVLFIQYLEGNFHALLTVIHEMGVEHIMYERRGKKPKYASVKSMVRLAGLM